MYYSRSKRYPRLLTRRQDLRLTAEQTTTKSGAQFLICWLRVTAGAGMGRIRLSPVGTTTLIPTFQGNFPNTRVQGWFFHFCQGVFRQVGRLSLRTNFMNNQEKKGKNADGISAGFEIINVGTSGQLEALF
ncbi:hypothetical protein T02_11688, partial [Trichinella nativa]